MENEVQSLRNSVKPLAFFYANKLGALLPLYIRPTLKALTPTTFVLTNFPGPVESIDVFGSILRNINLGGKSSRGAGKISKTKLISINDVLPQIY